MIDALYLLCGPFANFDGHPRGGLRVNSGNSLVKGQEGSPETTAEGYERDAEVKRDEKAIDDGCRDPKRKRRHIVGDELLLGRSDCVLHGFGPCGRSEMLHLVLDEVERGKMKEGLIYRILEDCQNSNSLKTLTVGEAFHYGKGKEVCWHGGHTR